MGIANVGKRLFRCLGNPARVKAELLRLWPATPFGPARRTTTCCRARTTPTACTRPRSRRGRSESTGSARSNSAWAAAAASSKWNATPRRSRREVGVGFQVWGFDTGSGMPRTDDPRDMLYVWQPGFFAMDAAGLKKKLRRAELVLGDVGATVPGFVEQQSPAPIGFIAFDLDYYSSTRDAFRLFDAADRWFLPRVFCYFDDVIGDDAELHSEFSGELLAIDAFNRAHENTKIGRLHLLRHKRRISAPWNDVIYVCHRFGHPSYNAHQGGGVWNYGPKR